MRVELHYWCPCCIFLRSDRLRGLIIIIFGSVERGRLHGMNHLRNRRYHRTILRREQSGFMWWTTKRRRSGMFLLYCCYVFALLLLLLLLLLEKRCRRGDGIWTGNHGNKLSGDWVVVDEFGQSRKQLLTGTRWIRDQPLLLLLLEQGIRRIRMGCRADCCCCCYCCYCYCCWCWRLV